MLRESDLEPFQCSGPIVPRVDIKSDAPQTSAHYEEGEEGPLLRCHFLTGNICTFLPKQAWQETFRGNHHVYVPLDERRLATPVCPYVPKRSTEPPPAPPSDLSFLFSDAIDQAIIARRLLRAF